MRILDLIDCQNQVGPRITHVRQGCIREGRDFGHDPLVILAAAGVRQPVPITRLGRHLTTPGRLEQRLETASCAGFEKYPANPLDGLREPLRNDVRPMNPDTVASAASRRPSYIWPPFHLMSSLVRIVDRYILREISVPFILGLAVFTMILLVARVLKLVELVVNRGVPFFEVVKLFTFILPSFLEVTIPMALLLAVLVGLGRLSSDSEIVALRASGMSLRQLARPIAIFAAATFVLALALSIEARPWGNSLLRNGLYEIAKVRASAGIRPKIFTDDFAGVVLYVDRVEPPGNVLQGIVISGAFEPAGAVIAEDEAETPPQSTVVASSGILIADEASHTLTLRLFQGTLHSVDPTQRSYHRTDFGTYDIALDMDVALANLNKREREPKEIATAELRSRILAGRQSGRDATADEVELARRYAVPFACLGFAAIALPLGIRPASSARAQSFAVSLGLILGYYLLMTLGESLAERALLPPTLALWIPNVVLVLLAVRLLHRAAREDPSRTYVHGFTTWAKQSALSFKHHLGRIRPGAR